MDNKQDTQEVSQRTDAVDDNREPTEIRQEIIKGGLYPPFGVSHDPPRWYYCKRCKEKFLAQDVIWNKDDQPRCPDPECDSILERWSD